MGKPWAGSHRRLGVGGVDGRDPLNYTWDEVIQGQHVISPEEAKVQQRLRTMEDEMNRAIAVG